MIVPSVPPFPYLYDFGENKQSGNWILQNIFKNPLASRTSFRPCGSNSANSHGWTYVQMRVSPAH